MLYEASSWVALNGSWSWASWDCDSLPWQRLWTLAASGLGFGVEGQEGGEVDIANLRWTARWNEAQCPVAVVVSKLAHAIVTFHRDWHGDIYKVKARAIQMLQAPWKHELELILRPEWILPRSETALQWHSLLFEALAQLSGMLCPAGGTSDVALDYEFFCQRRPWTLGCKSVPTCQSKAQWRKSPSALLQCAQTRTASGVLRCLRLGMPANPRRFLELVVPLQASWWRAVAAALNGRLRPRRPPGPFRRSKSQRRFPRLEPPCLHAVARREFLAAALCSATEPQAPQAPQAPVDGHVERVEVLPGRLEALAFAAVVRELPNCGVEVEVSLHVAELEAPADLEPCVGIACREQCGNWEASHYLRFACVIDSEGGEKMVVPAATASGHETEPALHTLVVCRLPRQALPQWLGGRGSGGVQGLHLEVHELDGVFSKPLRLKICPYQRPELEARRTAVCLKPYLGAGKFSQLLDDWLAYHRLMGADHFIVYDLDGSIEPLLSKGSAASLHQEGRLTYVRNFSQRMGKRMHEQNAEFWRKGLGNSCLQTRQVNHCLALSRSAGFEWFVYLRGMDKFLHSDFDRSPGMLGRFLDGLPQLPSFQVLRRHCGARDPQAMREASLADASLGLPLPIFGEFQLCEPLQLSIDDKKRDESWVPVMRASAVDCAMTNAPLDFNISSLSSVAAAPVSVLRAQHFVRAFEEAGEFAERSYAPSLKDLSRFTELDTSMDWAGKSGMNSLRLPPPRSGALRQLAFDCRCRPPASALPWMAREEPIEPLQGAQRLRSLKRETLLQRRPRVPVAKRDGPQQKKPTLQLQLPFGLELF
ncbi:slc25a42 [Symbiodinium sp. CCMP2592]|nr:slc25a42 [Symbiodinium sp. CCMP2592]